MIIARKHLPRRTFLRGVGATLALPLLDSMVPAFTAIGRTAAKPVRRLGVVYLPNGMDMRNWTPKGEGAGFEFSPILQPLAPFRDRVLVVSGLNSQEANAYVGEGVGDHSRGAGSFLTGVHIKKSEGVDLRAGVSMDQLAAQELGKETQLASLELALESSEFAGACDVGYSCTYVGTVAWRDATTPLPMENDPRRVFERLFGATDSTDARERELQLKSQRSILDAVTKDVARLERQLGPRDRAKLSQYLDAVRDIERRIEKAEEQGSRELPAMEQPGGIPATFTEHISLMYDLLLLAYQTDMTRVFSFMIGREQSSRAYPDCGVADSHHSVSHHQDDPARLAKLRLINTYTVQQFARFVENLRSTPDGDGSLLDHSMILYGAGISDSNRHSHHDLPIVLVGGGAGQIKGGRHLRYALDTPLMNLEATMLDKMGVPFERLGDANGRLSELSAIG